MFKLNANVLVLEFELKVEERCSWNRSLVSKEDEKKKTRHPVVRAWIFGVLI